MQSTDARYSDIEAKAQAEFLALKNTPLIFMPEFKDGGFTSAVAKATSSDFSLKTSQDEKRTLHSFKPSIWSWVGNASKAGDGKIFLSLDYVDASKTNRTKIIPINIYVQNNFLERFGDFILGHIEWVLGTIMFPIAIFIWAKLRKAGRSSHNADA